MGHPALDLVTTARRCSFTEGEYFKFKIRYAEELSVHADLFAGDGGFTPRPAWLVIEAARRQMLTGELLLATTPATRVYLRDGQVYFAERSTDGGLGVRLLVEGVITRQQMGKGALLVGGVEHLGRMFQRDNTIDRQSVELCVELMTDDVLTSVANDVIEHYTMAMYKRHPNGIDRWLPTRVEIITHIVESLHHAEPDAEITAGDGPRRRGRVTPVPESAPAAAPVVEVEVEVVAEVVADVESESEVPMEVVPAEPEAEEAPIILADEVAAGTGDALLTSAVPAHDDEATALTSPAPYVAGFSMGSWDTITTEQNALLGSDSVAGGNTVADVEAAQWGAPPTTEPVASQAVASNDSGISLSQSAMDAIMSTAIADEVAEAVRRALAAIDASGQPAPPVSPGDIQAASPAHA